MKKVRYVFFITVVLAFLCGCAFTPQQATLRPVVTVAETNIGTGVEIGVKVLDERPDELLGHRGSAYGSAAKITTDQDVAAIFYREIVEGLKKNGFSPVAYAEDFPRTLKVEIRSIKYDTSTGFWTGGVHTTAAIKALATNSEETYENFYRFQSEKRVVFVPSAKTNARLINETVSQVLNKLFNDQDLMAFLAR
ncbi:hypothetical protein HQ563_01580 [bacterium]|nr:hypothetical protein [bacterium]